MKVPVLAESLVHIVNPKGRTFILNMPKRLVDSGKAYYAFDSQEEIEAMKTKYAQSEMM